MKSDLKRHIACFVFFGWMCSVAVSAEIRTWSDATGKFKIEAKYVATVGEKVKLERPDGKGLEIEISKLSEADQQYLKDLESNPFKEVESENPFMETDDLGRGKVPGSGGTTANSPAKLIEVDWSQSEKIDLDFAGDGWDFAVSGDQELAFKPKNVQLPQRTEFFEGMKGMAINVIAQRAVVSFVNDPPGGKGATTRLVLCDLNSGKTLAAVTYPGEFVPLALHDDGQRLLMRLTKFGSGNSNQLQIWKLSSRNVEVGSNFTPHNDNWKSNNDLNWAEFIDENTFVTKSAGGIVAFWNLATLQPICDLKIDGGCTPALSADRKTLAYCTGERIGLFDTETHEVISQQKTPRKLMSPQLAFSPSGKRLGCAANNSILIWNTETGELYRDFETTGINTNTKLEFPDDDFVLAGNRYLIELENMIKLWDYAGAGAVQSIGGVTFFAVSPQNRAGALMPTLVPHDEALQALDAALNDPSLFIFRDGAKVRLDLNGIPGQYRAEVEANLKQKLRELNVEITDSAPVTIKCSVSGPKSETMEYTRSGTYNLQKYITTIEFLYENKVAWQSSGTNIPYFVHVGPNENLGEILAKASRQADYSFFKNVTLPKFVQKPTGQSGPANSSSQTIGTSQIIPVGNRSSSRR